MSRAVVVAWDSSDAAGLAERIRREGFEAEVYPSRGPAAFRSLRPDPPDVLVIDLMVRPSYGRAMGLLLREQKSTRMIPLVFLKGDPEKDPRTRELLPDAVFTSLPQIGAALRRAIERPPEKPVVPVTATPLCQKLKIQEGSAVALVHAPKHAASLLGALPKGCRLDAALANAEVTLAFVKSGAALARELPSLARQTGKGRTLWLLWPKKTSSTPSDLTMPGLRQMCLDAGLIDYKVCAVDATWSAIAVAPRRAGKKAAE